MASPLGHGLVGLALARVVGAGPASAGLGFHAFAVFATIAPDFDIVPGFFVGEPFRFHQDYTHSVLAIPVFAALVYATARVMRLNAILYTLSGALLYGSHLLIDFFSADLSGLPLLWPVSSRSYGGDPYLFPGVDHPTGAGIWDSIEGILTWSNVEAFAIETAILGPLFVLAWFVSQQPWQRFGTRAGPTTKG